MSATILTCSGNTHGHSSRKDSHRSASNRSGHHELVSFFDGNGFWLYGGERQSEIALPANNHLHYHRQHDSTIANTFQNVTTMYDSDDDDDGVVDGNAEFSNELACIPSCESSHNWHQMSTSQSMAENSYNNGIVIDSHHNLQEKQQKRQSKSLSPKRGILTEATIITPSRHRHNDSNNKFSAVQEFQVGCCVRRRIPRRQRTTGQRLATAHETETLSPPISVGCSGRKKHIVHPRQPQQNQLSFDVEDDNKGPVPSLSDHFFANVDNENALKIDSGISGVSGASIFSLPAVASQPQQISQSNYFDNVAFNMANNGSCQHYCPTHNVYNDIYSEGDISLSNPHSFRLELNKGFSPSSLSSAQPFNMDDDAVFSSFINCHQCAACGDFINSTAVIRCTVCDLLTHPYCQNRLVTVQCIPTTYRQHNQQPSPSKAQPQKGAFLAKSPPTSSYLVQHHPTSPPQYVCLNHNHPTATTAVETTKSVDSPASLTSSFSTPKFTTSNSQHHIAKCHHHHHQYQRPLPSLSSSSLLKRSTAAMAASSVSPRPSSSAAATPAKEKLVTSYVTDHIIAIHYPDECGELSGEPYSASISNAVSLVRQHHGVDNVLLVNVSGPRSELSGINVRQLDASWPCDLGPPLERLCSICKSIDLFLSEDNQHVVALHCKGAVGRLATVLLAYARYLDICTAGDSQLMEQIAIKTFCDSASIRESLTPSQLRYVRYFDGLLTGDIQINANPSYLHHIVVSRLPSDAAGVTQDDNDANKPLQLYFKVYQGLSLVYTSGVFLLPAGSGRLVVSPEAPLLLRGDVVIRCYHLAATPQVHKAALFNCQIHMAAFAAQSLSFKRIDLDNASTNRRLDSNFQLELVFSPSPQDLIGVQSPVETRYPIEYGHDSLIRKNSYEDLTNLGGGNVSDVTTMAAFQQQQRPASGAGGGGSSGAAVETTSYTPMPGAFNTGRRAPGESTTTMVVTTESQRGPNFDYTHVAKTSTSTTSRTSTSQRPANTNELDEVLGQLLTDNPQQQIRSQSRGTSGEFAAENNPSLKSTGPSTQPRLIVEEEKSMMPDKLPYKVGISLNDTRSARSTLAEQQFMAGAGSGSGAAGGGVRPAGTDAPSSWLEQQQLKLIAKREGADWLRRHEGEKQVVAELKGLISSSNTYNATSSSTTTTTSKLRRVEQQQQHRSTPQHHIGSPSILSAPAGGGYYSKSRSVSEMTGNVHNRNSDYDDNALEEKASQTADYFKTINSALDRLIQRSTSQTQMQKDYHTSTATMEQRKTPSVTGPAVVTMSTRNTTPSVGVRSPTPSQSAAPGGQPPKPVTYTVTVTPQNRDTAKHEYFVKTASRQDFVRGTTSSSSSQHQQQEPQAVMQRTAAAESASSLIQQRNALLQRSQSSSSTAALASSDRTHPWRSQTPGPVSAAPRVPVPVVMTNKSGQKCLSPVIHSSQMGTENLPSPRTLYIPATRRTETTTKHIIVSTETKRKKMTNEAGAQTENRETHATQTTPIEKEYEDIMLLKPIGRGLHNLEPDQQTFLRPTTPQAFARPYTPGMSGYATLDSAGHCGASAAAVSRSRSMQGIAGYPTMLRSPSVPINDAIPTTSPYIRQPLGAILPNNAADSGTVNNAGVSLVQATGTTASGGGANQRVVREQESEQTTTMHKEFRDGPFLLRGGAVPDQQQQFFMLTNGQEGFAVPQITTPGSTMPRSASSHQQQHNDNASVVSSTGDHHQYSSVQRVGATQSHTLPRTAAAGTSCGHEATASGPNVQTSSISINHPIHVDIYSGTTSQQQQQQHASTTTAAVTHHNAASGTTNGDIVPPPTPRFPTTSQPQYQQQSSQQAPRFVNDSSRLWYRANISRDEAITLLKSKQAGTFLIRDSNTFKGAYGLAIKVNQLPPNVQPKPGADPEAELVRHFLIERTAGGVRLKGCANEPIFPSLAALVYQHSITPLALPCALILPSSADEQQESQHQQQQQTDGTSKSLLDIGAACNVVYLGTVDCESLTGPRAVGLAVTQLLRQTQPESRCTQVHFKVNSSGITLTDNIRRLFFRRHYPPQSVMYCGIDPEDRKFMSANKQQNAGDQIFGFVARRQPGGGTADNQCHIFAELDAGQPASAVVDFINSQLLPLSAS